MLSLQAVFQALRLCPVFDSVALLLVAAPALLVCPGMYKGDVMGGMCVRHAAANTGWTIMSVTGGALSAYHLLLPLPRLD